MARLQDFQSVSPSSSDNLLIVQATGQGLATVNAVGQKVATETTMSNLNTTSKNLVGAVNEVNNKKASDIEYQSGVTVKQAIDSKADTSDLSWSYVGATNDGGSGVNIADYNEIMVLPLINGTAKYNPYMFWKSILSTNVSITVYRSSAYYWVGTMSLSSNVLSIRNNELNGWASVTLYVYGRKL